MLLDDAARCPGRGIAPDLIAVSHLAVAEPKTTT